MRSIAEQPPASALAVVASGRVLALGLAAVAAAAAGGKAMERWARAADAAEASSEPVKAHRPSASKPAAAEEEGPTSAE